MKTVVIACVILGCVIAGAVLVRAPRDNQRRQAVREQIANEIETPPAIAEAPATEKLPPTIAPSPQVKAPLPNSPSAPPAAVKPKPLAQNAQGPKQPSFIDPNSNKPIARQALGMVGADPVAEQYWLQAINDPNTSAKEREDLIEDLNEEGFDDPRNLTSDDLPLIESRLAIIEQLGPQATDEVNIRSFAEAYKDLTNMRRRLMRK